MSAHALPVLLTCSICHASVEHLGEDYYRYAKSGFQADVHNFSSTVLVCSKACKSQYVYNQAPASEQKMLRCLAMMCEINGSIYHLAQKRTQESSRGLNVFRYRPNEETAYSKFFDASDLFDMYELVEKIGTNLAGDGSMDAPEWYVQAIESIAGAQ